jgi:TRAP-type C4-dicarboxylate transport system substrate-binding protein
MWRFDVLHVKFAVSALIGVLLAAPAAPAAEYTIKLTTLAPRDSSYHRALLRMGQAWRQASGGAVELIIYPGGIQGGESAMVERMRINQTQAGLLTVVGLSKIEPAVAGLQNMPMMFRSLEEVVYVTKELRPMLEKRLLAKGFVVFFWTDAGWVRFFSKEPVIHPSDLKPMKLFTWAGDSEQVDIMKSLGFNPVPLETADILPGLQTGLISAVPMPPSYALANQIYMEAHNMLELNWAPLVGALVITKRAWDKIPAPIQEQIFKAAVPAGNEIKVSARKEADEAVQTMQSKWGLIVHKTTPEIEAEWRALAESVYPKIRGQLVPADIFDEVRRILQEYRSGREGAQ